MWIMVGNTQRVHFREIKDDSLKIWGALREVDMQKMPETCFNAYDRLFSIQKRMKIDLHSLLCQLWRHSSIQHSLIGSLDMPEMDHHSIFICMNEICVQQESPNPMNKLSTTMCHEVLFVVCPIYCRKKQQSLEINQEETKCMQWQAPEFGCPQMYFEAFPKRK